MTIVPKPVHVELKDGKFILDAETRLIAGADTAPVARMLAQKLSPATGFWFRQVEEVIPGQKCIVFHLDQDLAIPGLEGYRLTVQPDIVTISARSAAGLWHGAVTFLQLLPAAIFRQAKMEGITWSAPCMDVVDYPRFGWRGGMLDCARHFMPKEFVKKYIDLLSLHKMNSFHWHLTDDQGWRIEIKKYPRLTEVGAWRKQTLVGHWRENKDNPRYDGKPHGGFYTQEDIREIVQYAAERYINVVPEIEMPGHAQAAIAAYPELGNLSDRLEVFQTWGINPNVFNVEESTILFLQDVLTEVLDLFPSQFIHVGGDECPKQQWQESAAAQKRKHELGLKDEHELQSYFIRRMDTFLTEHGRRLIGWDEILEGGLAQNATVMSWRGEKGGIESANAGHDVVMAPNTYTYFDYYQVSDPVGEPLAIGGCIPLEKAYLYEPVPKEISPEKVHHILGVQGQIWTEYLPTPKAVEYMAYPRMSALAEVAWSTADKDYSDFLKRLKSQLERLSILDVNYRKVS
ncbi:MAG TPA: beta-N-acetylhexosaminidase [Anaerolineaceae bacterium]